MLRKLYCIGLLTLVSSSLGCALCCSPDDYNYAAYGGRWQRQDMSNGRVSSAYAEAGFDSRGDDVSEAEPATQPEPRPGDDGILPIGYREVASYID